MESKALKDFRIGLLVGEIIVRRSDIEKSMIESEGCSSYTVFVPKAETTILDNFYPEIEKREDALANVIDHFLKIMLQINAGRSNHHGQQS